MARPVLYRVILQRWGWLLAGHIGPVSVWHSPVNILVYRNLQGSFSLSDKIKLRSPPKTTQNNIGLQPVAPRAGMEVTQQGWGNLNVPTAALQPPGGSFPPATVQRRPDLAPGVCMRPRCQNTHHNVDGAEKPDQQSSVRLFPARGWLAAAWKRSGPGCF